MSRIKNIIFHTFLFLKSIGNIKGFKGLKNAKVVFIFPFYHTGGAEKVHLEIVKALKDVSTCVLFTEISHDDIYKKEFESYTACLDLSVLLKSRYKAIITKIILNLINANQSNKVVFGCNSFFFYESLPFLNKVKRYDLLHAFSYPDSGFDDVSLKYVSLLDKRFVINEKTKLQFCNQYVKNNIPQSFVDRIVIIGNGVEIPLNPISGSTDKFIVGFLGRGSMEKRPELFIDIAQQAQRQNANIQFKMAGSGLSELESTMRASDIHYNGHLTTPVQIEDFYRSINVILITSYREGFPLVVMESMARGIVPVCTDVGGIHEHIKNGVNGYLIKNHSDLDKLANEFLSVVKVLIEDSHLYNTLSENAYQYAKNNFSLEVMHRAYKRAILN